MNIITIFRIIFISLIILLININSNLIRFNIFIWIIMLFYTNPFFLHICHLIGVFQIITGWFWMSKKNKKIYRYLLLLSFVLFVSTGKRCIINEIIYEQGCCYDIGLNNFLIIFGIPILIYLSMFNYLY